MEEPLPFDHFRTLYNMLKTYSYPAEEVLVLEAIANSMDAKAKEIRISFQKSAGKRYVIFRDDGKGMNAKDFLNYHMVSGSQKSKGEGIGFAGVGAKIYLASYDGCEITTITCTGKNILASKMFSRNKKVLYKTSMKEGLKNIIGSRKVRRFKGTEYQVMVTNSAFDNIRKEITRNLQFWFNYALISGSLVVYVGGKKVPSWIPKGKDKKIILYHKGEKIHCHFWISDEEIPEERRHIVYSVYGKRIKNETGDFIIGISPDKVNKVFGIADVTLLTKDLTTSKEDFDKNKRTFTVRTKIKEAFKNFLRDEGLLANEIPKDISAIATSNELTRRLDKVLSSKDYRFLNPWLSQRVRFVAVPNPDGTITISEVEGSQTVSGTKGGARHGEGISVGGDSNGTGYVEDTDGDQKGEIVKRRSRGLQIVNLNFPKDSREGWVSEEAKAIIYNTGHTFAKNFENSPGLYAYNQIRVAISALVERAGEKMELPAKQAMDIFADVLHKTW